MNLNYVLLLYGNNSNVQFSVSGENTSKIQTEGDQFFQRKSKNKVTLLVGTKPGHLLVYKVSYLQFVLYAWLNLICLLIIQCYLILIFCKNLKIKVQVYLFGRNKHVTINLFIIQ